MGNPPLDSDTQFAFDLQKVMSDEAGKRFVAYLLHHFGLFKSSFNDNPTRTAYHEGLRQAALYLSGQISLHSPKSVSDIYKIMQNS